MYSHGYKAVSAVALLLMVSACTLFFPDPTLEGSFEETVVSAWASEGVMFMGQYGSGPITASTEGIKRTWSVEYPDEAVEGGQATGQLRITELAAYPIYASDVFARRLHERALEVDRRGGLTQEAWRAVTTGQFAAIAHLEAEVTRSTRTSRQSVAQYAVMPPSFQGVEAVWEFRDETRSINSLWRATERFYNRMMVDDDRVMTCAKGVDPTSNRALFLECATMLLDEEFGG